LRFELINDQMLSNLHANKLSQKIDGVDPRKY